MKISTQNAALIPQVETRIDRLTVLQGTVLRCIGALDGNTDAASRLVCEALQQVADELAEMVVHDTELYAMKLSGRRYRDVVKQPIDLESEKTDG
ncbi:MAG: hypothetical protein KDJ31_13125 [Candidatus Competibacteraceae bacterium]|nr:hypothetical protein [Candidatus Competibacteraceae bacterium]MCB1820296.1 hypothetical protein [Candidatus Competibacteraceae bacterium]